MVADVEYGFDPEHEAFNSLDVLELGYDAGLYQAHGNGVLGMLAPPEAGYGVVGMIPGAAFAISYLSPPPTSTTCPMRSIVLQPRCPACSSSSSRVGTVTPTSSRLIPPSSTQSRPLWPRASS